MGASGILMMLGSILLGVFGLGGGHHSPFTKTGEHHSPTKQHEEEKEHKAGEEEKNPLELGVSGSFVFEENALQIRELHPSFYSRIEKLGDAYFWLDFRELEKNKEVEKEIHIEEAFFDFNDVSKYLGGRVGKYRLNFGIENQIHPHDYYFINQALVLRKFFGPEALFVRGIAPEIKLPFRNSTLQVAYLSGEQYLSSQPAIEKWFKGIFSKFNFTPVKDLSLGLSYLQGKEENDSDFLFVGGDFLSEKKLFGKGILRLQGEFLFNQRKSTTTLEEIKTQGYYLFANYLFNQDRQQIGLRYDWSQGLEEEKKESGFTLVYGLRLAKQTALRVQLENLNQSKETRALAQLVFVLGSHKHPYPLLKLLH